jgi:hypothetical protein
MENNVVFQEATEGRESQGLTEQEEIILKCSNCDKDLVYIMRVNDDPDYNFTYQANCPFCGDKSFQKTIIGRIYHGPISIKNEESDNDDDLGLVTDVEDVLPNEDGIWEFVVKKAVKINRG